MPYLYQIFSVLANAEIWNWERQSNTKLLYEDLELENVAKHSADDATTSLCHHSRED
jgi:hypothetical protein